MTSPQPVSCPQCNTQLDLSGLTQVPPTVRCGQCETVFSTAPQPTHPQTSATTGDEVTKPRWRGAGEAVDAGLLPPGATPDLPDLPHQGADGLLPPSAEALEAQAGVAPTGAGLPALPGTPTKGGGTGTVGTTVHQTKFTGGMGVTVDDADLPHRRRGRGFGISAGWLVAIMTAIIVIGAAIPSIWYLQKGGIELSTLRNDDRPSQDSSNVNVSDEAVHWIDASRASARLANVKVKVDRIEFGAVRARDETRQVQTSEDDSFFQIFFTIESQRPLQIAYTSWYGNEFTVDDKNMVAQLTDLDGKIYPMLVFSDALDIHGHTPSAVLHEGREIRDTIVFEIPEDVDIAKSRGFRLELPTAAYNERGVIRFEIPPRMLEEARSGSGLLDGINNPLDRSDDDADPIDTDPDEDEDDVIDDVSFSRSVWPSSDSPGSFSWACGSHAARGPVAS